MTRKTLNRLSKLYASIEAIKDVCDHRNVDGSWAVRDFTCPICKRSIPTEEEWNRILEWRKRTGGFYHKAGE